MDTFSEIIYTITLIVSIISITLSMGILIVTTEDKKKRKESVFIEERTAKPLLDIIARISDVVCATIALLVFSPVMILICLCIKLRTKESVLVGYEIIGQGNRAVKIYRFRTKSNDPCDDGLKIIGGILIKTALRELPLLINVLKGDIALYGLSQIKCEKIEMVEKLVPGIIKTYNYYRPGMVSMPALEWNVVKKLDTNEDYYAYINQTNVDFLMNRSIKYLLYMMFKTVYLAFKPFDGE